MPSRSQVCSICLLPGHNKSTCPQNDSLVRTEQQIARTQWYQEYRLRQKLKEPTLENKKPTSDNPQPILKQPFIPTDDEGFWRFMWQPLTSKLLSPVYRRTLKDLEALEIDQSNFNLSLSLTI